MKKNQSKYSPLLESGPKTLVIPVTTLTVSLTWLIKRQIQGNSHSPYPLSHPLSNGIAVK